MTKWTIEDHLKRAQDMLSPKENKNPTGKHAQMVIDKLQAEGLSSKTVSAYYGAFKGYHGKMGADISKWPSPPPVSRKVVPMLTQVEAVAVIAWIEADAYRQPDHFMQDRMLERVKAMRLMLHAGMRPQIEACSKDGAWSWVRKNKDYGLIFIEGKGSHQREAVVWDKQTMEIENPPDCSYRSTSWQWKKGVTECLPNNTWVLQGKAPTLHSLRHLYAHAYYRRTKDLVQTSNLLGHADTKTTLIYLRGLSADEAAEDYLRAGG